MQIYYFIRDIKHQSQLKVRRNLYSSQLDISVTLREAFFKLIKI